MYEKYLESHDKPMETAEDALVYALGNAVCERCESCPCKMYSPQGCSNSLKKKAEEIFEEVFNMKVDIEEDDDVLKVALKILLNEEKEPPVCEEKEPQEKKCANCFHSKMHTSGIRFCESWHNFTHEYGSCYRWLSDIVGGEDYV